MGIELPPVAAPAANYVPSVRVGNLLFVSGQISIGLGETYTGKVGSKLSVEEGRKAARICAINILANIKGALGDLEKVKRIVKLTGFVNCPPEFTEPHLVINGCSDVLTQVLGERGKHARSAVGMASLPRDASVEVEAIVEVA